MEEIWKRIEYGRGNYYISNFGNVKNNELYLGFEGRRKKFSRPVKPWDNGNGYQVVSLRFNNKRQNFYVHRLVAEYFLGGIPNGYEINHLDYDKKNNNVSNLEVCTRKRNMEHSAIHLHSPRSTKQKSGYKYVYQRKSCFEVAIQQNGKYGYLGKYKTLGEAVKARDRALCVSLF